jgi:uncharacterized protein (TIGR00369 family)
MGTLHGGILCDIADAAMGMAFASTLAPDESFTTVELKINFFSPGLAGTIQSGRNGRAAGPHDRLRRVHHHRRENRLIAKAASACMALRGQKVEGL